ncbi:MAG: hypothetical protein ACI8SR_002412 [Oceanicoccus sp.]|jgi:hypothetical protein
MSFKSKLLLSLFLFPLILAGLVFFDLAAGPSIMSQMFFHQQADNLDFSFSQCEEDANDAPLSETKSWDNETLIINSEVYSNCGTVWLFGDYKINSNDELVLGYKAIDSTILACKCKFNVTYKINGIAKKDYKTSYKDYAYIVRTPFLLELFGGSNYDLEQSEEL